jgi:hypothetical protein
MPSTRSLLPLTLLALVSIASPAFGQSAGQTKVVKAPATIEKKSFDPKNRPAEMPSARGNEEGAVHAKFIITTQPGFTPGTKKQEADGKWSANVRTQQMLMQLSVKIEIWTPEGISEKAKAHLEGHRQIVEEIYKTADKAAAKIGGTYVGRGGKGTGDSPDAAYKDALKTLMESLAAEYIAVTEKRADRVQEIYDELTDYGAKEMPKIPDAIKQAMAQQAKEEAEAKKSVKKTAPPKPAAPKKS